MSSRERWTVYPLLFLTLLISVKDKLTKTVTTDRIVCKAMLVTDRPAAQVNARLGSGQIVCQELSVVDRDLERQVMLSSGPSGGIVTTRGKQPPDILLGHLEGRTGLMFIDANEKILPIMVMQPSGPLRGRNTKSAEQTPEQAVPLPDPEPTPEPVKESD